MEVLKIINRWLLTKEWFLKVYSLVVLLLGMTYIVYQYEVQNEILDAPFIGLLLGGTLALLIGVKWIQTYLRDFSHEFVSTLEGISDSDLSKLYSSTFANKYILLFSVGYALLVASSVIIMGIWSEDSILQTLIISFLFVINFLTGAALFSLFRLFVLLYRTSKKAVVKVYDRTNITVRYVTELSKRASIICALYVAFSMSSLHFSLYPINALVISYSIFAATMIVLAYLIPMIPIRNSLQKKKQDLKNEISQLLQHEFESLVNEAKNQNQIGTDKYNSLLELRSKISSVPTLPVGMKTIFNGFSVFVITLLPIIVQFILEKVIN